MSDAGLPPSAAVVPSLPRYARGMAAAGASVASGRRERVPKTAMDACVSRLHFDRGAGRIRA